MDMGASDTNEETRPSVLTIQNEFVRMLISLKDGKNTDRDKEEELLNLQRKRLEEIIKNPSPLYEPPNPQTPKHPRTLSQKSLNLEYILIYKSKTYIFTHKP